MQRGWSFVGRDDELARLATLIGKGCGALLIGEAGAGKSALAQQAAQRAAKIGAVSGVTHIVGYAVAPAEPFSAFARLIPARSVEWTPLEVARLVIEALPAKGRKPRLVVVDDINLLDESSAQVLLQLAHEKAAIVLATSRDTSGPAAVARLWQEGLCERIDVGGLNDDGVASALASALDGAIDPAVTEVFSRRSQGNPLLLRELFNVAFDAHSFGKSDGTWILVREAPLPNSLRDLIESRFSELSENVRDGLEMIAANEPVPLQLAGDMLGVRLLETLDAERLVRVTAGVGGPTVSTSHPLYGEVLRAGLSELRVRQLTFKLARLLEGQSSPAPHELVWAAQWRIDNELPEDPDRLLTAATAARAFSFETAERLARRAHEISPSTQATLLLADILTNTGKADEALKLTEALPPETLSAEARDAVVYCTAILKGWQGGDTRAGAVLVEAALDGDHAASDTLRGLQAFLLAFDGRVEEALAISGALLADPGVAPAARALAGLGSIFAKHRVGRFDEAIALADDLRPLALSVRDVIPWVAGRMEVVALFALTEAGRYEEAVHRGQRMLAEARQEGDTAGVPVAQGCLARTVLRQGKPASAIRLARDSLARLTPIDQITRRPIGALLARSLAIIGDVDAAREALALGSDAPRMTVWEPEVSRARAAISAAQVQMTDAIEHVELAGSVAADQGAWGTALRCFHDAARYGGARAVVERMREAASQVDGVLAPLMVEHAEALASRDAVLLDDVAAKFADLGDILTGAEASAAAALIYCASDDNRAATVSGNRAATLLAQCEGAVVPWLAGAFGVSPAALTAREREIARLAAAGSNYAEIGSQLFISPRTVQTHLTNIYRKLGIPGRRELAERLEQTGEG